MSSFDLLDEPWIPVFVDGSPRLVSLRAIFDGTPIREIRSESPLQDYAILRLVLAVFWRAHRYDPSSGSDFDYFDWREDAWAAAQSGTPDTLVLDYLDRYADRFDLIHPEHPFMQVKGAQAVADVNPKNLKNGIAKSDPVSRLALDHESTIFQRSAATSLSLDDAARWLVTLQSFDISGTKTGLVGDERATSGRGYGIGVPWTARTGGVALLGPTLRHTLVLNSPPSTISAPADDLPVWEREPDTAAMRPDHAPSSGRSEKGQQASMPHGPADLVTWQSCRVRLDVEGDRVVSVVVAHGDRIDNDGTDIFSDPMTAYKHTGKTSSGPSVGYRPRKHPEHRTVWRSLEPLIALGGEYDKAIRPPQSIEALASARAEGLDESVLVSLQMTGLVFNAKRTGYVQTINARIDVPLGAISHGSPMRRHIFDAARAAREAAVAVGRLSGNLARAAGSDYVFDEHVVDGMLAELEQPFARWIASLPGSDLDERAAQWQKDVRSAVLSAADTILRGAPPAAMVGRTVHEKDQGGKVVERLHSAGTAHRTLLSDLRTYLPLTVPKKETTDA